jgi:hypothetical protein
MDLYSVDSNEAMKQDDEALKASSLKFLSIVKFFIATIFYSALNASLPSLFIGNHCLSLHCHYFLKEICRLKLHRCYFLK